MRDGIPSQIYGPIPRKIITDRVRRCPAARVEVPELATVRVRQGRRASQYARLYNYITCW